MSTRKKFGRPAPFEVESHRPGRQVRAINLEREGGALEGAYATFSSREAVRLQPYETQRRSVISSSMKAWFGIVFFWISLSMILSTMFTGS